MANREMMSVDGKDAVRKFGEIIRHAPEFVEIS